LANFLWLDVTGISNMEWQLAAEFCIIVISQTEEIHKKYMLLLSTEGDVNKAWETIKENIKFLPKRV
jgi:hypothetical protein